MLEVNVIITLLGCRDGAGSGYIDKEHKTFVSMKIL